MRGGIMMYFFDIETNGLLDTLNCIHCVTIGNKQYRPHEVEEAIKKLQDGVNKGIPIVGHNIINFDIPAIQKVFPWFSISRGKRHLVIDTLVLSRLIFSNIKENDIFLLKNGKIPGKLYGSHSLEAWGYRLGVLKGSYGKQENAWETFNEEMLSYNLQDVVVLEALYAKLNAFNYSQKAIDLEHEVAWLISKQEHNGFPFDREKAQALEIKLRAQSALLDSKLRKEVPPIPGKLFIPKKNNKAKGYIAGVPIQRFKDFNPCSRQQIEWLLTKHFKYTPDNIDLFEGSRLKIDDDTFKYIKDDQNAPEGIRQLAGIFEEYLTVNKRLGQLADGKHAWLKCVTKEGFIHGSVNINGAVSGRATHSSPNIAQVPSIDALYGEECRELFTVPTGWYQVGVDASGLELRCLAHFMYPYDNGVYGETVLNGDIHTVNQEAAGLPTRAAAKRFIYAYLYGGGDLLIGKLVGGGVKEGKRIKKDFLKKTPALALLKKAIENTLIAFCDKGQVTKWKRKFLKGLDGRILHVRSMHSALNLLLQSAGALICKKWICILEERLINNGLTHGWDGDFAFMAWVHDECQIAAKTPEIANVIIEESKAAMRDTQAFFNFRVQLDTEGKTGLNWKETH